MKLKVKTFIALLMVMVMSFSIPVSAAPLNSSFTTVTQCICTNSENINFSATLPSIPASDDGMIYLYEFNPYDYNISATTPIVASVPATLNPSFDFPLNLNTPQTRLYSKFVLAVLSGGSWVMISDPKYITNPEILAKHTTPRKTESLNGSDIYLMFMYDKGLQADRVKSTMLILNCRQNQTVTHPFSRSFEGQYNTEFATQTQYYMLNCADRQGVLTVGNNTAKFAASHSVDNYVIGNEINTREYNYMAWTEGGWELFVREYMQTFRVIYNAVKSENANAQVFMNFDNEWDRNLTDIEYYYHMDIKDFITQFARDVRKEGDMDWGMSIHPYPVPLNYAKVWDLSGLGSLAPIYAKMIKKGEMISFQNMRYYTEFMSTPEMLNASGNVRTTIIAELGISANQGPEVQAAALYASFEAMKRYGIRNVYYSLDDPGSNSFLTSLARQCFDEMDGDNAAYWDAYAKSVIGISDWSQFFY